MLTVFTVGWKVHTADTDNLVTRLLKNAELYRKIQSHVTEKPVGYDTANTLIHAPLACFPSDKWKPSKEFFETSLFLLDREGERGERSLGLAQLH